MVHTQDYNQFFHAFRNESDRACAILARALLEDLLRQLFEAGFVASISTKDRKEMFEGQGSLATFSARIHLAQSLGLISTREAHDLNLVRNIGNEFAHSLNYEMSFNTESVKNKSFSLTFPQRIIDEGEPLLTQKDMDEIKVDPRKRFEIAVGVLWLFLINRINSAKPASEAKNLAIGF